MAVPNAHDKVVQIVRLKGPVFPSQINKELDTNIIFASAILSELVDTKVLKISSLKVGSSPLYYSPGQEYKLQNFSNNLASKEKEAYELLRQRLVLEDSKQEPAIRVALRQIKDFAKPLQVTSDGANQVFWKWYMLSNEEAENKIKGMLKIPEAKKRLEQEIQKRIEPRQEQSIERFSKPEIMQRTEQRIEQRVESRPEPRLPPRQEHRKELEPRKEIQKELKIQKDMKIQKEPVLHKETKKEIPHQQPAAIDEPKDKFFKRARKYFEESRISIIDYKILRKESEIDFTVKIPSTVGTLTYFCRAKNKKKITDGDLSSLYVLSQSKKMPILFLTTGELTKKAKELLEKEFKNISVHEI